MGELYFLRDAEDCIAFLMLPSMYDHVMLPALGRTDIFCISHQSTIGYHLLKGANDGEVGNHVNLAQLLVHHEAEDAHHGGTAVVQLDGALGELGLLIKGVPAEVEGSV
eukprot:CAMPEP_0113570828 /NCGR_PEP_ID=MMETSP0015_2-20120614/25207_1 /TAXON_ID=2838 /ORGANISM="Odontella" /LENGTH=108 /DNA_ID=CAMNT_0000473695 /DNA_START=245 /DNA_END=569 /DNA_ORIENTATION=+ /assembly_acc=CAM_ASM_000160